MTSAGVAAGEVGLKQLAGSMSILSAVLAAVVSPWFLLLTAFVGVNQWLLVLQGRCPASFLIERVFHVRKGCAP
mgnify:CR=1 FL=1